MCQRHPSEAVSNKRCVVDFERCSTYPPAIELCSAHACANTFDNQRPFKLGNRRHDDNDGPSQRAVSIDGLSLRQELHSNFIKLIEHLEKVLGASSKPVAGPNDNDVELASVSVFQHSVERWPASLRAADTVIRVFLGDLEAA
jgi:hypothetical protein